MSENMFDQTPNRSTGLDNNIIIIIINSSNSSSSDSGIATFCVQLHWSGRFALHDLIHLKKKKKKKKSSAIHALDWTQQ